MNLEKWSLDIHSSKILAIFELPCLVFNQHCFITVHKFVVHSVVQFSIKKIDQKKIDKWMLHFIQLKAKLFHSRCKNWLLVVIRFLNHLAEIKNLKEFYQHIMAGKLTISDLNIAKKVFWIGLHKEFVEKYYFRLNGC